MRPVPAGAVFRVAVLLLVVTAPVGTTVGVATPSPDAGAATDAPVDRLAPVPAQTNNTTQHEDPDSVSEDGDTDRVAAWFADRLGDQLRGSTLQLSQGEYELADQLVGEEYEDYLGRYVDVAGETDSTADDEAGSTFSEVQEEQRDLVNRTREYERTFREYQAAQEADETGRARELGRDLQRLAGEVNRSAVAVQRATLVLENRTDVSLTETRARLDALRREVLAERANVTADLFVGTRLDVSANRTTAAFDRPVLVTGQLAVTDGSVGPPDSARLQVGGTTRTVELDDQGAFSVRYRPTLAPVGPGNLTVRYLPEPDTPYLESEAGVPLSIDQVESSVDVSLDRRQVRFGEPLRVEGSVSAAGEGVAGVPVVVAAGDRRLGNVTTDGNGSYVFEGAFPAAVVDGQRSVSARMPLTGRAVGSANASAEVTVVSTGTDLTAEVVDESGTVRMQGQLATVEGQPVPDRAVRVDAPGMATLVTRTDAEGRYVVQFERPDEGPTNVTARFSGEGTNLNGSTETVRLSAANGSTGDEGAVDGGGNDAGGGDDTAAEQGDGLDVLLLVGAGLLALVVVSGGFVFLRRNRREEETAVASDGQTATGGADESTSEGAVEPEPDPVAMVEESLAASEYERASQELYALVRASLADRLDVADDGTHWEFYDAVTAREADAEDQEALRTVTETYEQATFAPTAVGEERARTALTAGERLLDGHETGA